MRFSCNQSDRETTGCFGNSSTCDRWSISRTDTITGGAAADVLTGGTGADTFVQAAAASVVPSAVTLTDGGIINGNTLSFASGLDVITDFVSGTDRIDVTTAGNLTNLFGVDPTGVPLTLNNNYFLLGTFTGGVFTVNNAATTATANVATAILANALAADTSSLTQNGWIIASGIAAVAAADFVWFHSSSYYSFLHGTPSGVLFYCPSIRRLQSGRMEKGWLISVQHQKHNEQILGLTNAIVNNGRMRLFHDQSYQERLGY